MNRRQLMPTIAATLAVGVFAQTKKSGLNAAALAKTANACLAAGETCLAHCHDMMAAGNKDMAACAKSVSETLAICTALSKLAAQNAPTLAKMAAVALDACKRCEAQCRKFASMPICKACADSCAACAAECAKA